MEITHFPTLAKAKAGETVMFSFIVYKSKAHRNAVNKKVIKGDECPGAAGHDALRHEADGLRRLQDDRAGVRARSLQAGGESLAFGPRGPAPYIRNASRPPDVRESPGALDAATDDARGGRSGCGFGRTDTPLVSGVAGGPHPRPG